jgi:SAM-dependent methyltransferase
VSTSLVYRSALGYELVMRLLYGRHYRDRMRAVAARVPAGSSVLELCCGPATLYRRHLRSRARAYTGVDLNERFTARLRRQGIDARQIDLATNRAPLPQADIVLMQASLYHFLPDAGLIVDRMLTAARSQVIVAEPIRNLASSRSPLLGRLGRRGTDPGGGGHAERFTEETLDALMSDYRDRVVEAFKIPGGREKVYVLAARAQ